VVLTAPGGTLILARSQSMSSMTIGAAGSSNNYEIAVLQSDGANFRVTYMSQRAAMLNGLQAGLPWNWLFPSGPGYQTTLGDNGDVVSSALTSSALAVTLPSTSGLTAGWAVSFSQDSGKPITVQVNSTLGGQIIRPFGSSVTSFVSTNDHQVVTLQFDGANFREITPPPTNTVDVRAFGATCTWLSDNHDDSPGFQAAVNALTSVVRTHGGTLEVPATGLGCRLATGINIPGSMIIKGMAGTNWQGPSGNSAPSWLSAGSWVECEDVTNNCMFLAGSGVTIRDLGFWYTQPTPAALPATSPPWAPTIYPYTLANAAGAQFISYDHLHIVAASHCIDWEGPSSGVGGIFGTMRDIWCDGGFVRGTKFHRIDNTLSVSGLRYDVYWNIGSVPMLTYMEANKSSWELDYVANMQADNIEFFEDACSILLTNDTVQSGFGAIVAAASALQLSNISFNEVKAAWCPTSASVRGDASMSNVIVAADTSTRNSNVMFDLTSQFALLSMVNVRSAFVQTFASIGPTSTLKLSNATIPQYSAFGAGANAFMVSAGGELILSGTSTRDILGAPGAGPPVGCGADSTCGWSQPMTVGFAGEGGVVIKGSADAIHAGSVEFMGPDGVSRRGYLGRGSPSGEVNIVSDFGNVVLSALGGQLNIAGIGGRTRISAIGGLPSTCSGLAHGDQWVDPADSFRIKECQ
jgi:hypothetical protein